MGYKIQNLNDISHKTLSGASLLELGNYIQCFTIIQILPTSLHTHRSINSEDPL